MAIIGKKITGKLVGRRIQAAMHIEGEITPSAMSQGIVAPVNSIHGIVSKALAGKFLDDSVMRYGDGAFYLPTISEIQLILQSSQLDRHKWISERFDCDDFSYALKGEMSIHAYETSDISYGLCVGMVWGDFDWVTGYHAVNWFISTDNQLQFIEPQTDTIYAGSHCIGNISLFVV
ncbi:MAG: lectin MOA-related protein [Nitrospiraceae bacterium]